MSTFTNDIDRHFTNPLIFRKLPKLTSSLPLFPKNTPITFDSLRSRYAPRLALLARNRSLFLLARAEKHRQVYIPIYMHAATFTSGARRTNSRGVRCTYCTTSPRAAPVFVIVVAEVSATQEDGCRPLFLQCGCGLWSEQTEEREKVTGREKGVSGWKVKGAEWLVMTGCWLKLDCREVRVKWKV